MMENWTWPIKMDVLLMYDCVCIVIHDDVDDDADVV